MKYLRNVVVALLFFIAAFAASASQARANLIPGMELEPAKPRGLRKTGIPYESNPTIRYWVERFTTTDRERFEGFMERGAMYKPLIQDILVKYGVPAELYYLAMIESGFRTDARSWASAVGVWQFIRPTARRYGLRCDQHVDERRDVIRATHAAARYLRDLNREFRSWNLAMAAYNSGEARVRRAIRRAGTRNYWKLANRGFLPSETSLYVPLFQAAMTVARNPERYGLEPRPALEYPKLKRVQFRGPVSFTQLAAESGWSVDALRALNPHVLAEELPARRNARWKLWMPTRRPSRAPAS